MNRKIMEIKLQYAVPVYNTDEIESIPDEELQFTINDQLFLDVLLMELTPPPARYSHAHPYFLRQTLCFCTYIYL